MIESMLIVLQQNLSRPGAERRKNANWYWSVFLLRACWFDQASGAV